MHTKCTLLVTSSNLSNHSMPISGVRVPSDSWTISLTISTRGTGILSSKPFLLSLLEAKRKRLCVTVRQKDPRDVSHFLPPTHPLPLTMAERLNILLSILSIPCPATRSPSPGSQNSHTPSPRCSLVLILITEFSYPSLLIFAPHLTTRSYSL